MIQLTTYPGNNEYSFPGISVSPQIKTQSNPKSEIYADYAPSFLLVNLFLLGYRGWMG